MPARKRPRPAGARSDWEEEATGPGTAHTLTRGAVALDVRPAERVYGQRHLGKPLRRARVQSKDDAAPQSDREV